MIDGNFLRSFDTKFPLIMVVATRKSSGTRAAWLIRPASVPAAQDGRSGGPVRRQEVNGLHSGKQVETRSLPSQPDRLDAPAFAASRSRTCPASGSGSSTARSGCTGPTTTEHASKHECTLEAAGVSSTVRMLVHLRFAPGLRLFLPTRHRRGDVEARWDGTATLGHLIESLGVPAPRGRRTAGGSSGRGARGGPGVPAPAW